MKVEKKGNFSSHSSNINVIDEVNICMSKKHNVIKVQGLILG